MKTTWLCSDHPVLALTLEQHRMGNWHASVNVDGIIPQGQTVTLEEIDSEKDTVLRTLKGYTHRGGEKFGMSQLLIVGGHSGGLNNTVTASSWRSVPAKRIITSIMHDIGETLSSDSDSSVLSRELVSWTIVKSPAAQALSQISRFLGCSWRVLDDGTVWFGTETYAVANPQPRNLLDILPVTGEREYSSQSSVGFTPGTTLDDVKVDHVRISLRRRHSGIEVWNG